MVKICSVDGCDKKVRAKNYCQQHYDSYRRNGNPLSFKKIRKRCASRKNSEYAEIELTQGFWAKCSIEDLNYLLEFVWSANKTKSGYVRAKSYSKGKYLKMSRVVAKRMYGHLGISEIDHINSDPLDNRRENLRLCSRSENNRNKTKRRNKKSSIYKGVFFKSSYKYKKWYCEIRLKKENIRKTKYFKTEKEAAIQYNEWAKELHKDFACLNDINT